jgi:hypothetical protein
MTAGRPTLAALGQQVLETGQNVDNGNPSGGGLSCG